MKRSLLAIGFMFLLGGTALAQSGGNPGNSNGNGNSPNAGNLPMPTVNAVINAVPVWFQTYCEDNATPCCPGGNHGQLVQAYRGGCLTIEPLGGGWYQVEYAGGDVLVIVSD